MSRSLMLVILVLVVARAGADEPVRFETMLEMRTAEMEYFRNAAMLARDRIPDVGPLGEMEASVIERWAQWKARHHDYTGRFQLEGDVEMLRRTGVDHAVVLAIHAERHRASIGDIHSVAYLEDSFEALDEAGATLMAAENAMTLAFAHRDANDEDAATAWFARACDYAFIAYEAGQFGDHPRVVLRRLQQFAHDQAPREITTAFIDRLQAAGLEAWVHHVIRGRQHLQLGWDARGSGFARTVTEEGWRILAEETAKASEHFEAAWAMQPTWPEPAANMITVALIGETEESARTWFDRSTEAQVDWKPAYDRYQAVLLPRWGGSLDAMREFAIECMNVGRFDTLVPQEGVVGITDIVDEMHGDTSILHDEEVRAAMLRVFDAMETSPYIDSYRGWNRSCDAVFACEVGDWTRARAALDRLGKEAIQRYPLDATGWTERDVRMRVAIELSDLAAAFDEAQRLTADGDLHAAAEAYAEIVAGEPDDRHVYLAAREGYIICDTVMRFLDGESCEIPFEEDLPGFRVIRGPWQLNRWGELKGGVTDDSSRLLCVIPFGYRYEIQLHLDLRGLARDRNAAAGVHLHFHHGPSAEMNYQAVQLFTTGPSIGVANRSNGRGMALAKMEGVARNTKEFDVTIQVWDGEAVVKVGDQVVYADRLPIDRERAMAPTFGLGSWLYRDTGYARYSNLRVRMLDAKPEELP